MCDRWPISCSQARFTAEKLKITTVPLTLTESCRNLHLYEEPPMRFVALWAVVLLAPWPAVRAQDTKKQDAQDMKVVGKLTADDRKDKMTKNPSKVHEHKMKAGTTYIIDLKSPDFDSVLRLEDSTGKQLAFDDDGGGFPDARITFAATKDDTYKIIATCYDGKVGEYTLPVKAASA